MRGAADLQCHQAAVAADAVVLVDDQVALGDFGGFGDELVGALAAAWRAADTLAQQVLLADQGDFVGDEAAFDAQGDQHDGVAGAATGVVPAFGLLRFQAVFTQQIGQALARAPGPGGDDGAAVGAGPSGGLLAQLLEHGARGVRPGLGEDDAGSAVGIDPGGAFGHVVGGEGE